MEKLSCLLFFMRGQLFLFVMLSDVELSLHVIVQAELDEAVKVDKDIWESKVKVDDTAMHFYRCNPQTEAIPRGPKASNDLSKLENLLRDPPQKHSFAAPIMRTG